MPHQKKTPHKIRCKAKNRPELRRVSAKGHCSVIKPNLVLTEVYFLTLVPMDTVAQALIQILKSILDHRT